MKLRAPQGCTSVSHGGRDIAIAADGSLDVADEIAAALAAHGFVPWLRDAPSAAHAGLRGDVAPTRGDCKKVAPDIESLNRPALFALLREKGVRVSLPISNAELRAAARRAVSVD
jgi:hypothetical protein